MGLISFAKNAGKRILRRDDDDDDQQEAPAQSEPAVSEQPAASAVVEAPAVQPAPTTASAEAAPVAVEPAPVPVETSAPAAASAEPAAPTETESGSEYFGGSAEAQSRAEAELVQQVTNLGIPVERLAINLNGDVATVSGTAATQADREKVVLAIGNTSGIAQVDDQLDVQEQAPEAVFYTVQAGDTLWGIAAAHYGDGSKYMQIFEANQPMLENPDLIYPGQNLRIPPL